MLKCHLKQRLARAVGACSSLIKMQHQILTGSQTLNEASSPSTVRPLCHTPSRRSKTRECVVAHESRNNAETPHSQPAGCRAGAERGHTGCTVGSLAEALLRQLQGFKHFSGERRSDVEEERQKKEAECTPLLSSNTALH